MALFASLSCPDPQIMLFGKRIPVPGSTHDGAAAVKEEEDQRLLSPRGFDEVGVSFGTSSSGTSDEEEENQGFAMNGDVKEKVSVTTGETSCTAAMAVKEAPLHQHGHDGNHSQQQDHHHQQQLEEVEEDKALRKPDKLVQCPRCHSLDTKFCYFNNYNVNQPRHFCKHCQRYWTAGGTLRNVPVGAGKRKSKHPMRQGLSPHGLLYTKEDRVDPLVSTPPLKLKLDLFERTQLVSESGFTKPSEIKDLGLDLGCGGHQDVNPELLNLQSAHVKVGEFKASQLNTHIGSSQSFKSRGPETSSCNVESNLHQFSKASSKSKDVQPSNTYVGYTGVRGLQAISHSGVFEPIEVDNTKRAHTGDPVINNKRAHTGDPVRAHDEMVSNCNTNRILSDQALPCRPPDGWNNGGGLAVPAMESLWPYLFNMYYTEMSHQGPPVMNSNTLWPWQPPFAASPVFGPQGWGLPCIGTIVPTVDSAQNAIARTSTATAATILAKHPLQEEMDGNSLCNLQQL